MSVDKLSGPQLVEPSSKPEQIVVFLHGYCADGTQLLKFGEQWQPLLPATAFLAPNAPARCADSPNVWQWFPLTTRDADERWRGVKQARPSLDKFLDETLETFGLDDSRLALVGFSQGAEMALHVGLRRPKSLAAIVAFSGILVGPQYLGETAAARGKGAPPVLLIHGDRDNVIPPETLLPSANALARTGIPCQWHRSLGIGHEIDEAGLKHGLLFLAECFGLSQPSVQLRG